MEHIIALEVVVTFEGRKVVTRRYDRYYERGKCLMKKGQFVSLYSPVWLGRIYVFQKLITFTMQFGDYYNFVGFNCALLSYSSHAVT